MVLFVSVMKGCCICIVFDCCYLLFLPDRPKTLWFWVRRRLAAVGGGISLHRQLFMYGVGRSEDFGDAACLLWGLDCYLFYSKKR